MPSVTPVSLTPQTAPVGSRLAVVLSHPAQTFAEIEAVHGCDVCPVHHRLGQRHYLGTHGRHGFEGFKPIDEHPEIDIQYG